MRKAFIGILIVPIAAALVVASLAYGEMVSYTANLKTSKGNPVYDILILETDGSQVNATIYPSQLPGTGSSIISHDAPFTPAKSLIIGLTEGKDTDGSDKTQIIMFVDNAFAVAHVGIPFSSDFPGTRHSTTIANLKAAVAGDATQLAWFTDSFFPGPAAAAAFDPRGPFTVAEFTSLTIDGISATAGNWMINPKGLQTIPFNDPDAIENRATEVINETAKGDTGPFDIAISLITDSTRGQFAVDKTVLNNTGVPWQSFEMVLGTGVGANFVLSTPGDGLYFVTTLDNRETTGAFPNADVQEDHILFSGMLLPGSAAHFIVFVGTTTNDEPVVTIRQLATSRTLAPLLNRWNLAVLAVLLCALAVYRFRALKAARTVPLI
ncbi:MAG: hypothetical protein HY270_02825 [Deltaproteobacteria bacterium]|nr:hypothetical protein [Deltaproteobacteria bacterium]